jgi:myosin heavy subunit
MDPQLIQKYGIPVGAKLNDFEYLKGTTFLPGDEKMLSDVRQSMKILPYVDAEECVWRVVAAILHLGNISFKDAPGGKAEVINL